MTLAFSNFSTEFSLAGKAKQILRISGRKIGGGWCHPYTISCNALDLSAKSQCDTKINWISLLCQLDGRVEIRNAWANAILLTLQNISGQERWKNRYRSKGLIIHWIENLFLWSRRSRKQETVWIIFWLERVHRGGWKLVFWIWSWWIPNWHVYDHHQRMKCVCIKKHMIELHALKKLNLTILREHFEIKCSVCVFEAAFDN